MTPTATTVPDPRQPSVIDWNGDGSYTPRCDMCGYVGKSRAEHAKAAAALRQHNGGVEHRSRLLGRAR